MLLENQTSFYLVGTAVPSNYSGFPESRWCSRAQFLLAFSIKDLEIRYCRHKRVSENHQYPHDWVSLRRKKKYYNRSKITNTSAFENSLIWQLAAFRNSFLIDLRLSEKSAEQVHFFIDSFSADIFRNYEVKSLETISSKTESTVPI